MNAVHVLIAVLAIFDTVAAFLLSLFIGTIVYIARLERRWKAVDAAVAEERARDAGRRGRAGLELRQNSWRL